MSREKGWESSSGGRKSRQVWLGDDEDEDVRVRENHKRTVRQKNPELLDLRVQAEQSVIGETAPVEVVPEPLVVPTKPEEAVVLPPVEVKVEEKEIEKNNGVVWYEGILDDLKIITSPGDEWSDVEWNKRRKIATRLRNKGVKLPLLSVDEKDGVAYGNRQQFQGAVEYLNPLFVGRYKREAITYLNNMGIGNGTGKEFLPGSVEAKQVEKKVEAVDFAEKEYEERERRANILSWLTALSGSKDEGEKETYLSALEYQGVKIRRFLGEVERIKPGRSKDAMRQLRAVVEIWEMDETKKREFPTMTKIAEAYTRMLGIE